MLIKPELNDCVGDAIDDAIERAMREILGNQKPENEMEMYAAWMRAGDEYIRRHKSKFVLAEQYMPRFIQ